MQVEYKYYLIYKTVNKLNNKFYVGMHRTDNLDDGYLGSGKNLKLSIKKWGIENFSREIVKFCSSNEEMIKEEREIINKDFLMRRDTYNCEIGGSGGKIWTEELRNKMSLAKTGNIPWNKGKKIESFITPEGKEIMKNRMSGKNNPMFGIDVATLMTPEANAERLRKISESNKKPKLNKEAYSTYAKSRFWIVNKEGKLCHCTNKNDERLVSGEFVIGRKWIEGNF